MEWMIYGANGYSGKLIANESVERGLKPILAARNKEKIGAISNELNLEIREFDLIDQKSICKNLSGVSLLLNCAGPFSKTASPLADACLALGVHYLDITGEIEVFERLHQCNDRALESRMVLMPGVGFDVVPTDCLSLFLKEQLPSARSLELLLSGFMKASPGTLKTMVENLHLGTKIRRDGKMVSLPFGSMNKEVNLPNRKVIAHAIPWGDVLTAYLTTGIPDVTVYAESSKIMASFFRFFSPCLSILKLRSTQNIAKKIVGKYVKGPTEEERKSGKVHLWGQVRSGDKSVTATLQIPEGYTTTVKTSLCCVEKVLKGELKPGFYTPAKAFGTSLIEKAVSSHFVVHEEIL